MINYQKRKSLIKKLFFELNLVSKYAILHHIDKIFSIDDDIDFITSLNKDEFHEFILNFCSNNNLLIGKSFKISRGLYRYDLFYCDENKLLKIELDCCCKSRGLDELKIDTLQLLKKRITVQYDEFSFYKISNQDEIQFYIKKKCFKGSDITKYYSYFKKLDNSITQSEISDLHAFWKKYFDSLIFKLKYIRIKINLVFSRLLKRPSLTICFLGPDGSGKSTLIESLRNQSLFISDSYFHLKPIKSNKSSSNQVVENPHEYPVYSKFKSYLKLLYLIIQYNIGWFINILPLTFKPSLIIFDRYFDDIIVDYKRYRYGGKISIVKFARYFIPKPDLYFLLSANELVIHNRKKEVSINELKRQIMGYQKMNDNKKYFQINVDRNVNDITNNLTKLIFKKINGSN